MIAIGSWKNCCVHLPCLEFRRQRVVGANGRSKQKISDATSPLSERSHTPHVLCKGGVRKTRTKSVVEGVKRAKKSNERQRKDGVVMKRVWEWWQRAWENKSKKYISCDVIIL